LTVDQPDADDQGSKIRVLDAPHNMKRDASLDMLRPSRRSHKTLEDTNTSRHYESQTQNSKLFDEKEITLDIATDRSYQNKNKDLILEKDHHHVREALRLNLKSIDEI
jgi:hypothetical protein